MEVLITPTEGVDINVIGDYVNAEPDIGLNESFNIIKIEPSKGDLADLLEWANSKPSGSILKYIEELVLENIEQ